MDLQGKLAVMRGPVVYCAEVPKPQSNTLRPLEDMFLVAGNELGPVWKKDFLGSVVVLEGKALTAKGREEFLRLNPAASSRPDATDRSKRLYRPVTVSRDTTLPYASVFDLTLIPYYAWANRGEAHLAVWPPVAGP